MATFDFRLPSLVVVGAGAAQRVGAEAKRLAPEVHRVLLVTDQNLVRLGHVAPAVKSLEAQGLAVTLFPEVNTEPTTTHIADGLAALRRDGCGLVVALGGGAPMDAGKAIAVMAANPGAMTDYMGQDKVKNPKLPLICIPTTAGTGSEVTRFTIITDLQTQVKMLIGSPYVIPNVALVDYTLTLTCPREVTAGPGLDAFIHALEAYLSRRANPISDTLALSAMGRVARNIRRAWANGNDAVAREQMTLGSLEAGMAFSNASVALIHGMSRPIGAYFHVPHGVSNAMLLPVVARFNQPAAPERLTEVARVMGVGRTAAAAVRGIAALCRDLEIPTITGYGIDRAAFLRATSQMARDAIASGSPGNNPRSATEAEIVALYRKAL